MKTPNKLTSLCALLFTGLSPLACEFGGIDTTDDVPGSPDDSDMGIGGASTSTGGQSSTGGGGSTCEGPRHAPETYLCAGYVQEEERLGHTWQSLFAQSAGYACGSTYSPGTGVGGASSTGGATSTGGGWASETGGASYGGSSPDDAGSSDDGSYGGAYATGGSGPIDTGNSGWCEGLDWNTNLAGVSYRFGDCQDSELALPVRFQEPNGWFELSVYAGSSACERGTLLTKTSGYGLGRVVELPVTVSGDVFVSLELTTEYDGWDAAYVQQITLPGPTE